MTDNKFTALSGDFHQTERDKLAAVFPECFVEGKLDIDKLLNLCGEYIDEDFEKYKFEWKGKADCFRVMGKRSAGTLRPAVDESVDWETTKNLYIEGDNLEVLKLLQTAYYRKVKMIYIDPPYNTGNDFVYNDDFADPIAHYKEVTSQATKSNPETMGRFHTAWLNMMYPRLRLAANLLRDDGVCFISIDDNEVVNLSKICDEVFGEENFVGQVIWERAYAPVNLKKHFSPNHDFVLCYAKNLDLLVCNGLPRGDEANDRYKNPDNDPRGEWKSADLSVGPAIAGKIYEITTPTGRIVLPPDGRCWVYTKERFEEMLSDNRIWFGESGNNVPSVKKFLSEVKGTITPMTIWKYNEVGHSQDATKALKTLFDGSDFFDYPKPVELVKRMLALYTNDSDIILDFFSGSATTAHAVMQINAEECAAHPGAGNRRFIMVQLPETTDEKSEAFKAGYKNICEIGKERIRRAGRQIVGANCVRPPDGQLQLDTGEHSSPLPDTGFRVFKLDTSNLHAWDTSPLRGDDMTAKLDDLHARFDARDKTLKPDRSDLDIVHEVMLKMGIPLDMVVSEITVGSKKCYSIGDAPYTGDIGDCLVLVCLDHGITPEDVHAFCDLAPAKIVAAEEAFEDSTATSNAHYILKDRDIEMKLL